jgi:hypothetical protein
VTALCPGAVDTTFWDGIPGPPDCSRMLKPRAVAEAALLVAAQPSGTFVEEICPGPDTGDAVGIRGERGPVPLL